MAGSILYILHETFAKMMQKTKGVGICMKRVLFCLVAVLMVAATPVLAADVPNLTVSAAYTAAAPVIDGVLNDAAWLTASQMGAKVVVDMNDSSSAITPFPRVAYLAYDDTNLYLGFAIPTQDSSKLVTSAGSFWNCDEVEVSLLAPGGTVYKITVTAGGKVYEGRVENASLAAVSMTSTGWVVEMVMPFASAGKTPGPGDTWAININGHQVADGDSWLSWNATFGGFGNIARFGNLVFLP